MVFSFFRSAPPARKRAPRASEKRTITIAGQQHNIEINRRRNLRRMTLRIRDHDIGVSVPLRARKRDIDEFIREHRDWIEEEIINHEKAITDALPGLGQRPVIYYQGQPATVRMHRDPAHEKPASVHFEEGMLNIRLHAESRLRPVTVLEKYLRQRAREDIQYHLDYYLPLLEEDPVPVSIREQKTRWGSCSTDRRLSFNWRLIMSPPESLEYVVAHEAVHLIYHDHSPDFWDALEAIMPHYRPHEQWLRDHETALFVNLERCLKGLRPMTGSVAPA